MKKHVLQLLFTYVVKGIMPYFRSFPLHRKRSRFHVSIGEKSGSTGLDCATHSGSVPRAGGMAKRSFRGDLAAAKVNYICLDLTYISRAANNGGVFEMV